MKPAFILVMIQQKRNTILAIFQNTRSRTGRDIVISRMAANFKTADELVNAPIYDGKSLKSRWDKVVIVSIEGLDRDDWMQCCRHV